MPETNPAVAAQPAATPQPNKPTKIKVSQKPQKKGFDPSDVEARKAWIAKKRAEHQKVLTDSGYTPVAVLSVMKYMASQHGYEKKASKDNLCYMFADFAECLKYKVRQFDRDMSAAIAMCIVDANANIASENNILNLEEAESSKKVQEIIEQQQSMLEQISGFTKEEAKEYLIRSVEEDARHDIAKKFKEIDAQAKDDATKKAKEYMDKGGLVPDMPPRPAKQKCPKCGENMLYLFNIQKHICTNPLCEDYRPPRRKREDGGEGGQQRRPFKRNNGEGFRSGKPVKTQSGADRFKQRYAKKLEPKVAHTAAPIEEKIIKDKDGKEKKITVTKSFSSAAGTWDALDALKIPQKPADEQPAVSEAPAESVAPASVEVAPTAEAQS